MEYRYGGKLVKGNPKTVGEFRALLIERNRTIENIKAREERLNNPEKMKAYAKGRNTVEYMTKLAKDNNAHNKNRVKTMDKFLNSKEGKSLFKQSEEEKKKPKKNYKFRNIKMGGSSQNTFEVGMPTPELVKDLKPYKNPLWNIKKGNK
tara:strand:- start:32 stop:478 length:447 start_codon:yes stop_codon:yes gene_type:complete